MKQIFTRIFHLLLKDEKRQVFKVSLTVFINAILDFASLAAILPVLYYLLGENNNHIAALLFCVCALTVFVCKYFVSTRLTIYQQAFLLGLYKRLSFSLYNSYFKRGLLFIRQNGFSKLGYEVNAICYGFSESVLAPALKMVGDVVLILLIVIALTFYSPLSALVLVIVFIPFVYIYISVVKQKMEYHGKQLLLARRNLGRIVNDTYAGYADLEVSNAFDVYSQHFVDGIDQIRDSRLNMASVSKLPTLLMEIAVVVGLSVLSTGVLGQVNVLLGIFAVAAFKVLPALRSVLSGWTQIKKSLFCLDVIEEGMEQNHDLVTKNSELSFNDSLVFDKVSYHYPDGEPILSDLSFTISKGEYVGVKGYSGVGKSTLFNLLLGFIKASSGRILIDDKELESSNLKSWHHKIGYVPQDVFIFKGNLLDNITMGIANPDLERVKDILCKLDLGQWLSGLSDGLNTDLCELGSRLSGGQKQRIGIARALYKNIDILLLDEATSALDNDTEQDINRIFKQLQMENRSLTIVSIAHRDSSIAFCDRVIDLG